MRMLHIPSNGQQLTITAELENLFTGHKAGDTLVVYHLSFEWSSEVNRYYYLITLSKSVNDIGRNTFKIGLEEYQAMRSKWLLDNNKMNEIVGIIISQYADVHAMYLVSQNDAREVLTHIRMDYLNLDPMDLETALNGQEITEVTEHELDIAVDYCYDHYMEYSSNPVAINVVEIDKVPTFKPLSDYSMYDE